MKTYLFFISTLVIASQLNAQVTDLSQEGGRPVRSSLNARGYYITPKNDTVHTIIEIRSDGFNGIDEEYMATGFYVVENNLTTKWFKPSEVKEYGFTLRKKDFKFFSKSFAKYRTDLLKAEVYGAKAILFKTSKIRKTISGYGNQPYVEDRSKYYFLIEKPDGTSLTLSNEEAMSVLKNSLKEFLKDDPRMEKLIDKKVSSFTSLNKGIRQVIEEYNKN